MEAEISDITEEKTKEVDVKVDSEETDSVSPQIVIEEEEIQEEEQESMILKRVSELAKDTSLRIKRTPDAKRQKTDKVTKRERPNHFIAIQVSDPVILEKVTLVQNTIIQAQPKLQSALIPLTTLHVTLGVMHFANKEEIDKAIKTLGEIGTELQPSVALEPLNLHFRNLGHFNNKVVFAQLSSPTRTAALVKELRSKFQDFGFELTDDFNPHLTLLKLSRDPRLFRKGIRKIDPNFYEEHLNLEFGYEKVTKLQLLSMSDPKDESGYYTCKGEFIFDCET